MKDNDLQPWLIGMGQGDEEAFKVVYESTRDQVYRLIYYLAPQKQDAADIMSEVYMELLRSIERYDHDQKFSAWLNGLVVRQVRSWKRKNWRVFRIMEKARSMKSRGADNGMEEHLLAMSDQIELLPALDALSHKLREIVVLRYYQDYSLEEISTLLDIPLGTVKSRNHQALKKMRQYFERNAEEREASNYVH